MLRLGITFSQQPQPQPNPNPNPRPSHNLQYEHNSKYYTISNFIVYPISNTDIVYLLYQSGRRPRSWNYFPILRVLWLDIQLVRDSC